MLSRACHIAIRSSLFLTLRSGATFVSTKEIGKILKESHHFVAKVLHQLAVAGLLHSYRGPNGGVALSRSPEKIYLGDIISIIDGDNALSDCVLGSDKCSNENPCALHQDWKPIREQILSLMASRSLSDLARQIRLRGKSEDDIGPLLDTYLRQETHKS